MDVSKLKGVPHLIVWGDYLDKNPFWGRIAPASAKYAEALAAAGAKVDTLNLPAAGIKGNTHMLMMDTNSDDIAKLVHEWIAKQNLVN